MGPATQAHCPLTPQSRVGCWTAPSGRGGALNKPIHFPSLSRSGEGSTDHNHVVVKKKITRGR